MEQLMNIAALVLITAFVPVIVLNGLKVFGKTDYHKAAKIVAMALFFSEVVRFFAVANKFELGRIPATDLKIGFVTFVSVFALFAAFLNGEGKVKAASAFLKKVFVLLSFTVLVIGMCENRVYTLEADRYAIVKGMYFLESGLSVLLSLLFLKAEPLPVTFKELLTALGICVAFCGLSVFYIFCWNLDDPFNAWYFIEKGLFVLSVIPAFLIVKRIGHAKALQ